LQEVEDKATKLADVITLADHLITINKVQYRIVEDHDSGFSEEKIEERYNNVLDKYDYIVGDWGYDQLRFKGFYEDGRKESTLDNRISYLEDYLLEYCNFGCAYFVLEKVKKAPVKSRQTHPTRQTRQNKNSNQSHHKANHNFRTRTTHTKPGTKATTNKAPNKNNPKKKTRVTKRHSNKKPTTKTTAKKSFKIRKIGEENK